MGKATSPKRAVDRDAAAGRKLHRGKGSADLLGPTPEQAANFVVEGLGKDRRHKRIAYIETLAISPRLTGEPRGPRMLTRDQLLAARTYRERYDQTQASLTRCALDVESGGRGTARCLPPTLMRAWEVRLADDAMGAVGDTVRAVVLHDMDFSAIAIMRFGHRLHRYQKGKNGPWRYREVPRSGRHREIVRDEFLLGIGRLEQALRPYLRTGE